MSQYLTRAAKAIAAGLIGTLGISSADGRRCMSVVSLGLSYKKPRIVANDTVPGCRFKLTFVPISVPVRIEEKIGES